MFGLGWMLGSTATGALLGGIAAVLHDTVPWAGIVLWASSGISIGAAQWLLMRGRLDVSLRWWVVATGGGAFLSLCIHFYFGLLFFKTGDSLSHLISKHGYNLLLWSVVTVIAGGLALGIPQLVALRNTDIRWRSWLLTTLFGFLALWLGSLGLWSMLVELFGMTERNWPRPVRVIAGFASNWTAVSLAQAFVIAPAVTRRAQANLDSRE